MAALTREAAREETPAANQAGSIRLLVMARIACKGGATRAEIVRDINALVAHKLSPAEWRTRADVELAAVAINGLAAATRGRYTATPAGLQLIEGALGPGWAEPVWADQRDIRLAARALGLAGEASAKLKMLATPDGLKAAIVQKAFGLAVNPRQSLGRLRADLAVVALERAFGNKIKSGLGAGGGLSAKAARLLAGQLSRSPKDYGTDGRLVSQLAMEAAHATSSEADALRAALLKAFVTRGLEAAPPAAAAAARPVTAASPARPANDAQPPARAAALDQRPDLPHFSRIVAKRAGDIAEGWPGNRKAYISHVWQAIRASEPQWSLSEIEFKCMLAEAHRAGHIVLANADLKDKRNLQDLEASAILYKNTVWHFVRVED